MSPESVAALLARRAPAFVSDAVEPLGEGDFFLAYSVGGSRVVRVAKHAEAAEALRREACLLPRIAPRLPLAIPRPELSVGAVGDDPAFAVQALLPGPALTRERWEALPEPARDRCARQVGEFLAALHRTDASLARACGVETTDYRARYGGLRERARSVLLPRIDSGRAAYVEAALSAYLASGDAEAFRPVLLHGDLSPDHVMYDGAAGEVSGIIDFGDVALGDPAWDLVYIAEDYGPDFLAHLLPAFAPDAGEHAALLARTRRFLELDAVAWAVHCAGEGEGEALEDAMEYLDALRAEADSPLWHDLPRRL